MSLKPTLTRPSDLFTQDLAGTHKRAQTPSTAPGAGTLAAYDSQGYVILKGLLSEDVRLKAERALRDLLGPTGRNNFEGFNTQRA